MQLEDFKSEKQILCEKISALPVKISHKKKKTVRFAEKVLYYDEVTSESDSKKKSLLEKQSLKILKKRIQQNKSQNIIRNKSVSVFLCHYFKLQYYA